MTSTLIHILPATYNFANRVRDPYSCIYARSIEQPQACTTWKFNDPETRYLLQWSMQCHRDQCVGGLKHPKTGLPMKKATRVQTSLAALEHLSLRCPGPKSCHLHEHALGTRRVQGTTYKLSVCAGRYPSALCKRWAEVLRTHLACNGPPPRLK